MISTLFARADPVSYPELRSLLVSHEIRLANQQASILPAANLTITVLSQTNATSYTNNNSHGHGRGRGHGFYYNEHRDPCLVCSDYGHSPYRCRYRHQGRALHKPTQPPTMATMHLHSFLKLLLRVAFRPQLLPVKIGFPILVQHTILHQTFINFTPLNLIKGLTRFMLAMVQVCSNVGHSSLPAPSKSLHLSNIHHVPSITKPLLFVSHFTKETNCYFEFFPTSCVVKDRYSGLLIIHGKTKDGIYYLQPCPNTPLAPHFT